MGRRTLQKLIVSLSQQQVLVTSGLGQSAQDKGLTTSGTGVHLLLHEQGQEWARVQGRCRTPDVNDAEADASRRPCVGSQYGTGKEFLQD